MAAEQPHLSRRVRPGVIARNVLLAVVVTALAAVGYVQVPPAVTHLRGNTELGARLFGDAYRTWRGGSFPAASTVTVPRYRVVPTPAIHLSAAARQRLKLDKPYSSKDENGEPHTYTGHFKSYPRWGTTAVEYSFHKDPSARPVGSQPAIAAARALFADVLGQRPQDWYFEVGFPWPHGALHESVTSHTWVQVHPVAEGKPLKQYGWHRLGGYVRVDSSGILGFDLALGTLVREGSTRVESAADAWNRGRHHRDSPHDDSWVGGVQVAFTKATLGTQFPPAQNGKPMFSAPTWTFSGQEGEWISVSPGTFRVEP